MAAAAKGELHAEEVLRQIVSYFLVDAMETGDVSRAETPALKANPVAWPWPSMLCVGAEVRLLRQDMYWAVVLYHCLEMD